MNRPTFAPMEYFKIGKIVATHGVDGKLVITHSLGKKTGFFSLEALFTEDINDTFLPWFITYSKGMNETETMVSLEGIKTKEDGRKLIQKEIWLAEEDFKALASHTSPISLLGFNVIENEKPLGAILEVIEQPHQVLCKIILDRKEAWIPIHEATLVKIDQAQRQVVVTLPDGLLDVFLQS